MNVQSIEPNAARALHHFFEAEVRTKFGVTDKDYTSALHLQKNANLPSGHAYPTTEKPYLEACKKMGCLKLPYYEKEDELNFLGLWKKSDEPEKSYKYYPFGLTTANSWTRENTTGNQFLGNGGTELNATSNVYDLEYRQYDPVLGRMNGVDPMASKYSSLTPYNYAFNDPVSFNDVNGADPYTINYSATTSQYYTMYTYDDRIDPTGLQQAVCGQCWREGNAGAMAFYGAATGSGSFSSWQASTFAGISMPTGIGWGNILQGVGTALASSHGGEVNLRTGSVSFFDERGSMIAGAAYMTRHGTMTASIATALSNYFTPVYASAGDTEVPEYFEGAMIIDSNIGDFKYGAAMTLPGVGIFLSKDYWSDRSAKSLRDLLKHEYGHILQAEKWGKEFFYEMVGPISINSAREYRDDHKYTWTERTANYFSREYFKNERWNYSEFPIYYPTHKVNNKSLDIPPFGIPLHLPVWWDIPESLNRG